MWWVMEKICDNREKKGASIISGSAMINVCGDNHLTYLLDMCLEF